MKLVRGRAFGLRNTAMICGCPLDRLLATCPFSEAHSYNCLAYILYRPPAKISVHNVLSPRNIVEHLSDDSSLLPLAFLPQVETEG